ncbi:MAG: type II toxin-antitoxin system VapC family toxin [Bacteroidales bacterium]|nr:type II toxin-antitoxin system VapC family toxin [Bacteroidales bacterium]
MDKEIICLDTSVFIDYFRKQKKEKTFLVELADNYDFAISVITKLEISVGISSGQSEFWDTLFEKLTILPLYESDVDIASSIIQTLRKANKIIGLQDILIASTAISNNLRLATLNLKDFERIENLKIIKKD